MWPAPPYYTVSWRSCRYVLQYQSLHELQQDMNGEDARVSQAKTQLWAYMLARQVRSNHRAHPSWVWWKNEFP